MSDSPTATSSPAPSEFVLAERRRRSGLGKALSWYTDGNHKLTITPIYFPMPNEPAPDQQVTSGVCACGGKYEVDERGVTIKQDLEDPAVAANGPWCTSPGKHPVRRNYLTDPANHATTYEDALELWKHNGKAAPFNIGIVHGQSTGIVVFDVDVRANGLASMTALSSKLSEVTSDWAISSTLSYHTSGADGRGFHLFYRADRDDKELWRALRQMGENILPGVEVKWKSGMVVAAPSLHASGQAYSISSNLPIAELTPERLGYLRQAVDLVNGKTTPTATSSAKRGSWAALAESNQNYNATVGSAFGGDLSWDKAPEDDASNPGYWSRQLTYFLMTGRPARQFGPGEHHDSLKPLIGALAKVIFAKESFCRETVEALRMQSKDQLWVPAIYGALCYDLDAAVTIPKPWQQTDPGNLRGMMRYSLEQELRGHGFDI